MGLSASSLSSNSNYTYRSIQQPFANRAEISRGLFRVPSADAVSPSNTAYGTNANASLAASSPAYVSSAQVLAQNAVVKSNVITTQPAIETGTELEQALNQIASQTPGSRFNTKTSVFQTQQTQQPQSNANIFSNTQTSSNITTQRPVFESTATLTGRNASVNAETAANLATVNANYNLKVSQEGTQALQALQRAAMVSAMHGTNVTSRMDGMIPVAAATLSDFSSTTSSSTRGPKVFDNITETFNHIMGGGGQGGGGSALAQPGSDQENPSEKEKKKGINFMA